MMAKFLGLAVTLLISICHAQSLEEANRQLLDQANQTRQVLQDKHKKLPGPEGTQGSKEGYQKAHQNLPDDEWDVIGRNLSKKYNITLQREQERCPGSFLFRVYKQGRELDRIHIRDCNHKILLQAKELDTQLLMLLSREKLLSEFFVNVKWVVTPEALKVKQRFNVSFDAENGQIICEKGSVQLEPGDIRVEVSSPDNKTLLVKIFNKAGGGQQFTIVNGVFNLESWRNF